MAYEYRSTRRVEFSETDRSGTVHFTNFLRYMESAEHAFFRSLGFSIHTAHSEAAGSEAAGSEAVGWPRVHASCEVTGPLRFEDSVEVRLLVRERRQKSIVYEFVFRKMNDDSPTEVARGSLAVVCVRRDSATGKMTAVRIPKLIAGKIEAAPAELLAR